ncbi:MAG: hypothetical protein QXD49_00345 [Archaeoglobaceae archaeon]
MNGELEHVCTGEKGFRRLRTATELRILGSELKLEQWLRFWKRELWMRSFSLISS